MKSCNILKVLTVIYLYPCIILSGELYPRSCDLCKGDTIRITMSNSIGGGFVGTAIDVKRDTLTIQIGNRNLRISLHDIQQLEVARGRKSNTTRGLMVGAISGGLGLGLVAAISVSGEQDGFLTPTLGQAFLGGLASGGLLGGLFGAIIGSGTTSMRWVRLQVEGLNIGEREVLLSPESKATTAKQAIPAGGKSAKANRRWEISFALGTTSGGPAKSIEQAMIRDGWNEKEPIYPFTFGPAEIKGWRTHPYSKTGFGQIGVPCSMQISYSAKQKFDIAVAMSHAPIGVTYGYRNQPTYTLVLNYSLTTAGLMIVYKTPGILQFGLGPVLTLAKMKQENTYREEKIRFGALAQAGMQYPQRTRFFITLKVQYRWTPKATFGPFKDNYRGNSLGQLDPFEADFSHIFAGLGIGIRL